MQVGLTAPCLDLLLRCQLGAAGGTVSPSVSPAFPTSPTRSGGSSEHPAMRDLREAAVPPLVPTHPRCVQELCHEGSAPPVPSSLTVTAGQERGDAGAHRGPSRGRCSSRCCVRQWECGGSSAGTRACWHRAVPSRCVTRCAPTIPLRRCPHGRARSKLTPGLFHPYSPQPQRGRSPAAPHSPAPYK